MAIDNTPSRWCVVRVEREENNRLIVPNDEDLAFFTTEREATQRAEIWAKCAGSRQYAVMKIIRLIAAKAVEAEALEFYPNAEVAHD